MCIKLVDSHIVAATIVFTSLIANDDPGRYAPPRIRYTKLLARRDSASSNVIGLSLSGSNVYR
jgi:hypothetical protein